MRCRGAAAFLGLLLPVQWVAANVNIDGGRSQLPGMKQDMFDQAQQKKRAGGRMPSKGPPDCPKSDHMSPFWGLTYVDGEWFAKLNSTDEKCTKLITISGANFTTLVNASRTCGPAGEWKKRIAEELSAVFFQGGLEWVKHENETIEIQTENGTFEIEVNEAKYAEMSACWARGCDCEQAKNPIGRGVLYTLLAIGIAGLSSDGLKLAWSKIMGKKEKEKKEKKEKKSKAGYNVKGNVEGCKDFDGMYMPLASTTNGGKPVYKCGDRCLFYVEAAGEWMVGEDYTKGEGWLKGKGSEIADIKVWQTNIDGSWADAPDVGVEWKEKEKKDKKEKLEKKSKGKKGEKDDTDNEKSGADSSKPDEDEKSETEKDDKSETEKET